LSFFSKIQRKINNSLVTQVRSAFIFQKIGDEILPKAFIFERGFWWRRRPGVSASGAMLPFFGLFLLPAKINV